ncbi:MAG TPA: SPW repeat protein [Actinocatenispora sp.]
MADTAMERHPDLVELRERYERAAARPVAQVAEGLTFMAGIYLAISPWVLGFEGMRPLTVSNLVCGLAYCVVAMAMAAAPGRMHKMAWVMPVIGAWAIVSPWLIRGADMSTTTTVLNNVIIGAVCVVLGLGAMSFGMGRRRMR